MYAAAGSEAKASYGKSITQVQLPSFTIAESNLGMGASLGNSALWLRTNGTGAIEDIFLNDVGKVLIGSFSIRYGAHARPVGATLSEHIRRRRPATYSALFPVLGSRVFEIHPAYQSVRYELEGVIEVSETTFLALGASKAGQDDPPFVYAIVEVFNRDQTAHNLRISASATLRGATPADVQARFDESAGALVASNKSAPELVRIFGVSERPVHYGCDFDFGATYDVSHLHTVKNDTAAVGDVIGRLQLDVTLAPRERRKLSFTLGLFANGERDALQHYRRAENAETALEQTIVFLDQELRCGTVLTPDPVVNHGALWSKVNMRRVMASYPTGCAFTNDPGTYANVVTRDAAWFVFGNDHFVPSFSRDLLDNIGSRTYPNGKLPEYFDAVTGRVEDDGLNINDDTPLYILAVNHHFRATGDIEWLRETYPIVANAARCIISQIDDRDLVFCTANDPAGGERAIAGWRNIIPGYRINGAVTEINAECVAALRAASHLAENLGGHEDDAREFAEASKRVRAAMDRHLINPDNGLYYLNIDVDGNLHTDVTGDQVFPVMLRTCDDETAFRIISRLNCADFWTSAGLRTASRYDPRFDPTSYSGLKGGVWPGLTWWFAFAAARYHPEFMVRALRSSFEHYGAAPRKNNTVPGQFSEWFDGESLTNRGMRLSPWEPPRFLWAAIEGVCGVMLAPGPLRVNPLIPADWNWVGLRQFPYHGDQLTYFVVREGDTGFHVHSTMPVESDWGVELYSTDVSDSVGLFAESAVTIALAREDAMAILVGNTGESTIQSPITIHGSVLKPATAFIRIYNSERRNWESLGQLPTAELRGLSIQIEANGFRLVEISFQGESGLHP